MLPVKRGPVVVPRPVTTAVAPQIRQSTLVVANLRPGDYDAPKPDPKLRIDVAEYTSNDDLDDKAEEGQGTESTLPGIPE